MGGCTKTLRLQTAAWGHIMCGHAYMELLSRLGYTLWKWDLSCNEDPRMQEIPGIWTITKERWQHQKGVRRAMDVASHRAFVGAGLPKLIGVFMMPLWGPNAWRGTSGCGACPYVFQQWFAPIFPRCPPVFLLCNENVSYLPLFKYILTCLNFTVIHN